MKIHCIIVEDEPKALGLLQEYIAKVDTLMLEGYFHNALDALNYCNSNEVDLVFLDINLPGISGLELSTLLPERTKIIFTTAYSEFAIQSYEANAVDYLLKPITFSRFLKAVNKASLLQEDRKKAGEEQPETSSETFFVKSGKKIVPLRWAEICYVEGMKEYIVIVTSNSKTIVYKRMKELEEILPKNFLRIHNSFIINMNSIEKVEDNHVYMLGRALSIGKKYKTDLLKLLSKKFL